MIGLPYEKDKADVTCVRCQHTNCVRAGCFGKRKIQRWKCTSCKSRFSEAHQKLTRATITSQPELATRAIQCLLEGCSIRSTERLTGLNRNTIMSLLILAGQRCEKLMNERMRQLPCRRIQSDEIWTFLMKKAKNVRKDDPRIWRPMGIYSA